MPTLRPRVCYPYEYLCVFFVRRTNSEVVAHEGGTPVFLTVSRSNGLETAVSVEWETQADTAVGSGTVAVFFGFNLHSSITVNSLI